MDDLYKDALIFQYYSFQFTYPIQSTLSRSSETVPTTARREGKSVTSQDASSVIIEEYARKPRRMPVG